MGFIKSNNLNNEIKFIKIPSYEDSIGSFFENLYYVLSLRFFYDILFKEWKVETPNLK
jgi:hypothetical protein